MSMIIKAQDHENFRLHLVKNGYITEDGSPLKCPHCNGDKFEYGKTFIEEGYTVEYSEVCSNCKEEVGYWSYGQQYDFLDYYIDLYQPFKDNIQEV